MWLPRAAAAARPHHRRCTSRLLQRGKVTISSSQLEKFILAELSVFAESNSRPVQPLQLREIFQTTSAGPQALALLLHKELPVRFARRIKSIESMPRWTDIPELGEIASMQRTSFREMRLVNVDDQEEFRQVIQGIRLRHLSITPLFAQALKALSQKLAHGPLGEGKESMSRKAVDEWADCFLSSRVSTEMQMSNYISAVKEDESSLRIGSKIGLLDTKCNPVEICQRVIAEVQGGPFPCLIEVENPCGEIHFCQAPRYLYYILLELLKNSARATCKAAGGNAGSDMYRCGMEELPVKVSVCANDTEVVIRVSDRAGGLVGLSRDQMWSFLSMCSASRFEEEEEVSPPAPLIVEVSGGEAASETMAQGSTARLSPMVGRGIGLPLSRLYAKFLGGSLQVVNLPGLGVDAYLFLPRLHPEDVVEGIPAS